MGDSIPIILSPHIYPLVFERDSTDPLKQLTIETSLYSFPPLVVFLHGSIWLQMA